MLRQRLAADDETVSTHERGGESSACSSSLQRRRGVGGEIDGVIINPNCSDDHAEGANVMPSDSNAHKVGEFVKNAVDSCIGAGFSRSDCDRVPSTPLLRGRASHEIAADTTCCKVRRSESAVTIEVPTKVEANLLEARETEVSAAAPNGTQTRQNQQALQRGGVRPIPLRPARQTSDGNVGRYQTEGE